MSDTVNAAGGGIGFGGLLALLFITLKLTGHINWLWLWVLSPLWIPVAFIMTVGFTMLVCGTIVALVFKGDK